MLEINRHWHTPARCLCLYPALLLLLPACDSTLPSTRLQNGVSLPVPATAMMLPGPDRLSRVDRGEVYRLSPRAVLELAFNRHPEIKSSFQRFKSEEARYDFFVVSRDSLTPQFRTSNVVREGRSGETVDRDHRHTVKLSVEKRFFDTTELDVGLGLRTDVDEETTGYHPFVSASLRYPLWVSREKLARTSEEIFRRNELNDAQLGYIQKVRGRLQFTLWNFYEVMSRRREMDNSRRWQQDLKQILPKLDAMLEHDLPNDRRRRVENDRSRLETEIDKVSARVNNVVGRFEIACERLKAACGLPFHAKIEMVDEPFHPFEGANHEELLRLSIEEDPEIATLRNEEENAEEQLKLARQGRWDVTLRLDGNSSLEGSSEDEGVSDWSISVGMDVSAVDPRVTDSLINQAQARITRFSHAIIARENHMFVETLDPLIRIETLNQTINELEDTLHRLRQHYDDGVEEYVDDKLNMDDLISRRSSLYRQEQEISRHKSEVARNTGELCAATGKFFELLAEFKGD